MAWDLASVLGVSLWILRGVHLEGRQRGTNHLRVRFLNQSSQHSRLSTKEGVVNLRWLFYSARCGLGAGIFIVQRVVLGPVSEKKTAFCFLPS